MPVEFFYLASPVAALAVMVAVQGWALRLWRGEHFFRSVVFGFVAGFATVLLLQVLLLSGYEATADRWVLAVLVNIPLYVCLAYGFYNFINLGQASIRIRIYKECVDRGGRITEEELRAVYDEEKIREARLERLLQGGDIAWRNGTYRLARTRLVPVARIVFGLKKFVLRRESEFDHLA